MCHLTAKGSNKLVKINIQRQPLIFWNIWCVVTSPRYPMERQSIAALHLQFTCMNRTVRGNVLPKLSQKPIEASQRFLGCQTIQGAKANFSECLHTLCLSSIYKWKLYLNIVPYLKQSLSDSCPLNTALWEKSQGQVAIDKTIWGLGKKK